MTCRKCQHGTVKLFGKYGKRKIQRYRCNQCRATFTDLRPNPLGTHYTDVDQAAHVVSMLMEGMSIRATSRLTGTHKNTILSLLLTIGENCQRVLDAKVRNIRTNFVQADEAWTPLHCKQRRLRPGCNPEWGDQYVWFGLDSETKMVLSHHVGKRDSENAYTFINDLSERIEGTSQLTTDGLDAYVGAVEEGLAPNVHYAQLIKVYGRPRTGGPDWYRPSRFVTTVPTPLRGRPITEKISTSHVERMNLNLRMHVRRFTRLTNAFSKSMKHLKACMSLFVAWYNFCRIHQTLRVTPAMQAQLVDHQWTVQELLGAATQI